MGRRIERGVWAVFLGLASLQVSVATTDRPHIVGVSGSELVSIDVTTGASTTLFVGNDLGGQEIVWSPDESFAYISAYRDEGLLIFDGDAIVGRIPIVRPDHASFHPTRPLALVQGTSYSSRAPLFLIDTRTHTVIEELSAQRSGDPWVFTADGRWAMGSNGDVVDLDRRLVHDAVYCEGPYDDDFYPIRPWGDNELLIGCRRYLARYEVASRTELGRVYFRDVVLGVGVLPGGEVAMVVTGAALHRVALPGLEIIETIPYPDRIPEYSRDSWAYFPDDGSVVALGDNAYFRTADLSYIGTVPWSRMWEAAPILPELVGKMSSSWAWRKLDRSYYYAGDEVVRFDVDSSERTTVVPNHRIRDVLASPDADFVYVLLEGSPEVRKVPVEGGSMAEAIRLFESVDDHPFVQAAVSPAGDAIHYRRAQGANTYFFGAIDFVSGASLGSIVIDAESVSDFEFTEGLDVQPLSRTRALIFGSSAQFGFVDLTEGELLHSGGRDAHIEDRIVDTVADPAGDGAYLLVVTELEGTQVEVPVIRSVVIGQEAREVWRGPVNFQPKVLVAHPSGSEMYVALSATHNGKHRLAVVDVATGATRAEIPLPSYIQDLAISDDGRHLIVALSEEPHLIVVDTVERAVVGAVRDAPRIGRISLRGTVTDASELVADPVPPELPPSPDVVVFEDWWTIGPDPDAYRSLVVADSTGATRLPRRDDGYRLFSLSTARGGRMAYVAEWRLANEPPEYVDGTWTTIDLESGAVQERALDDSLLWTVAAPQGDVAFSVRSSSEDGEIVVSVIDLATDEVVHSLTTPGKAPFRRLSVSPDGTYVAVSHDPLVVMDTRDSRIVTYDFSTAALPAMIDDHAYYTLADDGRWLWRVAIDRDSTPEQLVQLTKDKRAFSFLSAAPSGEFVVAHTREYNRSALILVAGRDGSVSEVDLDASDGNHGAISLSTDAKRMYVSKHRAIEVFEIESGARVARIPTERIPTELRPDWLVVGCAGACPTLPATPRRTPWGVRGTVAPTPVGTPRPTPSAGYDWFEIDPIVARPGDQVEVRLRHRSTAQRERSIALRNELILPTVLEPVYWSDGTLDCEGWYRPWDRDRSPVEGRFEARSEPCAANEDCTRVTAMAASDRGRAPNEVVYRCRARVRATAAPGKYEIASENLVVESWDPAYEPFVVPGSVIVVTASDRPTPTPTTGRVSPPPRPRQRNVTTIRGSNPGGVPGEEVGVGFTMNTTGVLPGGMFDVQIEIPDDLTIVRHESGYPRCSSNSANYSDRSFEIEPGSCRSGPCSILTFEISLETGTDYYHPELALDWLRWFDLPIFECRYVIAPDTAEEQIALVVRSAVLNGRSLATEPGVVQVHRPESTPTLRPSASVTPTASMTPTTSMTPTPVQPARRCEPIRPGRAILCIEDLEADPGEHVELVVRYRSGGASQAGVQFDLRSDVVQVLRADESANLRRPAACRVDPAAMKEASSFALNDDRTLRSLIISFSNLLPLPDDLPLVTCTVRVPAEAAPGLYELTLENVDGSSPVGQALALDSRSGLLRIRGTVRAIPTVTVSPTPATRMGGRALDASAPSSGEGCQVSSARRHQAPVILLALVLFYGGFHRRRRPMRHVAPGGYLIPRRRSIEDPRR